MTTSVVVTGASSGLGRAASAELAAAGHHVVLACRSTARGEAAAEKIRSSTPGARLEVLNLDLASLASVRSAASTLAAGGDRPPLHGLVCNAGIQIVDGVQRSPDGYELTFATNHLGHFLLITLLLDHLAEPGRIVLVSSEVHQGPWKSMGFPAPRWDDPHALADPDRQAVNTSGKAGRIRYATSKLANIYTTYELARRLGSRQITVNAFDPGLMPETRLDQDYPPFVQWIYHQLAPLLVRMLPGARPLAQSGADLAWWATSPDVAGVSGVYCSGRSQRSSSKESYDQSRAAELWKISEELVTVTS